jgi:hypothetical protein
VDHGWVPYYVTDIAYWQTFWPVPGLAVIVALVLSRLGRTKWERRSWSVALFAISMLGAVTGLMSGLSRAPAMGAILPAVLGLVGGVTVYLVGRDIGDRLLVSLAIIALTFTLFIGGGWGASLRQASEDFRSSEQELKRAALVERNVQRFREKLGLSPCPPSSGKEAPETGRQ